MSAFLIYSIVTMLCCFAVTTFFLSKIDFEEISFDYEFKLDPFWPIFGVMFIGVLGAFYFFPPQDDSIVKYGIIDFILPFIFAFIILVLYFLDLIIFANIATFLFALAISFMQPDDFLLFPDYLPKVADRLAIASIIFVISKGFSILNGLGAIASLQFIAVPLSIFILAYFGIAPQILAIIGMVYLGTMLAFTFFSWPPEKLIISEEAFSVLGFILGCFMLNASTEYMESTVFVACSYLFTEIAIVFYNYFLLNKKEDRFFMNTSYFRISNYGEFETPVVYGVLRILIINVVLSCAQVHCVSKLSFPMFSIFLNLWFLSILSGDTKPQQLLSFSKWTIGLLKRSFKKENNEIIIEEKNTKNKKKTKATKSTNKIKNV